MTDQNDPQDMNEQHLPGDGEEFTDVPVDEEPLEVDAPRRAASAQFVVDADVGSEAALREAMDPANQSLADALRLSFRVLQLVIVVLIAQDGVRLMFPSRGASLTHVRVVGRRHRSRRERVLPSQQPSKLSETFRCRKVRSLRLLKIGPQAAIVDASMRKVLMLDVALLFAGITHIATIRITVVLAHGITIRIGIIDSGPIAARPVFGRSFPARPFVDGAGRALGGFLICHHRSPSTRF